MLFALWDPADNVTSSAKTQPRLAGLSHWVADPNNAHEDVYGGFP